jgi:CheY-like chemotaxis protein
MACVLVVEDERNIRLLITTIMRQVGHEVMEAADGRDALSQLAEHMPDLVLTDLRMPRMTGIQLIEEVKKQFPDMPVMVVSAFSDQIEKALENGASYYLRKPFAKWQLVDAVDKVLEHPL